MGAAFRSSDPGVPPLPLPAGLVQRSPLAAAATARRREATSNAGGGPGTSTNLYQLALEARSDPYGSGGAALLAEIIGGGSSGSKAPSGRRPPSPERPLEVTSGAAATSRSGLELACSAAPTVVSPGVYFDEWARRVTVHGAHAPLLSPAAWAGPRELFAPAALRSAFPGVSWLDISGLTGRPGATLDFTLGRLRVALGTASATGGVPRSGPDPSPWPASAVAASVSLDVLGQPVVAARPAVGAAPALGGASRPVPPLAIGGADATGTSLAWVSDLEGLCTAVSAPSASSGAAYTTGTAAAGAAVPGIVSQWRVIILRAADWLVGDRGVISLASASPHVTILLCFGSDEDVRVAVRFLGREALRAQRGIAQQYKAAGTAAAAAAPSGAGVTADAAQDAVCAPLPPVLEASLDTLERANPAAMALRQAYDVVMEGRGSEGQLLLTALRGVGGRSGASVSDAAGSLSPYDTLCAALLALHERHGISLGVVNPPPWGGGGIAALVEAGSLTKTPSL